jgi:hypothetical protein
MKTSFRELALAIAFTMSIVSANPITFGNLTDIVVTNVTSQPTPAPTPTADTCDAVCKTGNSFGSTFDPSTLTEVGLGLGGNPYWSHPAFANALWNGAGWLEFGPGEWGTTVGFEGNPQFDSNGFPKYLNPGKKLRAMVYALHANPGPRPDTWPDRTMLARGKVVIIWQGDADVRANGGSYVAGESSGSATGRLVDGRRVYRFSGTARLESITVEDINTNAPIANLKVWLPDPADPDNLALENQVFHPTFLARIGDAPWAFLRFMDWNESNASPQRDWADRRLPTHAFQWGVLNRRAPATGFSGDRGTGIAFEQMVALANLTGRDMWINIPHLATDDFIIRLARLIRFGSDGVNPYTNTVASPVFAPLNSAQRVFVEYSNEIWSNGDSFAQGNWAQEQANALGISKPQFNARRFSQVWRIFEDVFAGETSRIVRVAAVWTGLQSYTEPFLNEIAAYGPTLAPPQTADLIAPTTYFGNGIQDWAYAKAQQQAGTADPWFFTTNTYTDGGTVKPVSVPSNDSYWTGTNVTRHLAETFTEWKRRLLSGATQTGGGPDATGIGGGFDVSLRTAISNAFGTLKPIVSYEGGPSIFTDYLDLGDVRDDGITTFMELLNRHTEFAAVYRIHLNLAKAKGLRTHGAFVDVGAWGKYGQWGHLEYLGQDPNSAVKWRFIRDWPGEVATLRQIDEPLGARPDFVTPAKLATAVYGQPYTQDISVTDGNGALALQPIDQMLTNGLTATNLGGSSTRLRIDGTPMAAGENFLLARVNDADGDPAWRTFYFKTVGGPGTLLESNFEGTNPAQNLPWMPSYVLRNGLTYSGWSHGAGIIATAGNDALVWSQNMPPDTAAFSNLTSEITLRLHGYAGQYGGHRTSVRAFNLKASLATAGAGGANSGTTTTTPSAEAALVVAKSMTRNPNGTSGVAANDSVSQASFWLGASRDQGESVQTDFTAWWDEVLIAGSLAPQLADVGQPGDIFVVIRTLNGSTDRWSYLGSDGVYRPWDGRLSSLEPAREVDRLEALHMIQIFSGTMATGNHRVFLGYSRRNGGGPLHYTPTPMQLYVW